MPYGITKVDLKTKYMVTLVQSFPQDNPEWWLVNGSSAQKTRYAMIQFILCINSIKICINSVEVNKYIIPHNIYPSQWSYTFTFVKSHQNQWNINLSPKIPILPRAWCKNYHASCAYIFFQANTFETVISHVWTYLTRPHCFNVL